MSERYVILLLLVLLLNVASCREDKEEQLLEGSGGESRASFDQPKRALNFGTREGDSEKASVTDDKGNGADQQIPAEGRDDQLSDENSLKDMSRSRTFFERAGTEARYPTDLIIGRLLEEAEATAEEGKILDLINRWIGSFGEERGDGQDGQFYSDESREILTYKFQDFNQPVDELRLGRIEFQDGLARLDLRLFSGSGRTAGEIVLQLSDRGWRILAADLDLEALLRPYQRPEYEKDPPVYGTMQI